MSEGFFRPGRRRPPRERKLRQRGEPPVGHRGVPVRRRRLRALRGVLGSTPVTLVLALLCAAAGAWIAPRAWTAGARLARGGPFRLEAVRVFGAAQVPARTLAMATGAAPGAALIEVDVRAAERRLEANPWVDRARALRLPPSRLLVKVREKQPRAVAADPATGQLLVVDDAGVPFAPAAESHASRLPHILRRGALSPGEVHADLARAVALLRALRRRELPPPVEIDVTGEGETLAFRLPDRETWLILGPGEIDPQLERLGRARSDPRSELTGAASMDLRFAGQVVLGSERGPARGRGVRVLGAPPGASPAVRPAPAGPDAGRAEPREGGGDARSG